MKRLSRHNWWSCETPDPLPARITVRHTEADEFAVVVTDAEFCQRVMFTFSNEEAANLAEWLTAMTKKESA